jgi:CheY-like chemotaxis protein
MSTDRTETVVLVVEDDTNTLSGYLEFLNAAGYSASGCRNGVEALSIAFELVPDAVVTDITMPGIDGFALAGALHGDQRTRHVPIIGVTAHWNADMQSEANRAGFSAMLLKPCLPSHLVAEVQRAMRHAELLAAALGREAIEIYDALPLGLGRAVLRDSGSAK